MSKTEKPEAEKPETIVGDEKSWATMMDERDVLNKPTPSTSVSDFDYNEIRKIDPVHLDTTQLLQILIVRGSDPKNPNPALRFGTIKLLRQLHGERLHDDMSVPQMARRGGGRGHGRGYGGGRNRGRGGEK